MTRRSTGERTPMVDQEGGEGPEPKSRKLLDEISVTGSIDHLKDRILSKLLLLEVRL